MKYIDIFSKLVFPFIGLYILYTAYSYADNLDSCKCADHLKPYIDHIKTVEQIFIVIQLIGIVINIVLIIFNPINITSRIPRPLLMGGFGMYFIFILFMAGYFVRNVWHFEQQLPEDCECALLWQRNILYIQALLYTFSLFIIFIVTLILLSKLLA
jgi:uncharacterized membrane protein